MPTQHHEHPDVDCEVLADAMGPTPEAPGAQPPPPPVRAARLLAAGDRVMTRLDTLLERALPRDLNPLAHLGAAANAMVLLATLSGVLMLFWYSPSVVLAWHSLADLAPHSLGGLVRSVHRYSSDLLMLLVLTHALRMLLARKFAGARWLAWASGITLVGLVWFIGWTGYWLVWDERAQLLALDTIRTLDVLPIFGEPMLRLFAADRTVPSLLFSWYSSCTWRCRSASPAASACTSRVSAVRVCCRTGGSACGSAAPCSRQRSSIPRSTPPRRRWR
jgi:hypothetical protein